MTSVVYVCLAELAEVAFIKEGVPVVPPRDKSLCDVLRFPVERRIDGDTDFILGFCGFRFLSMISLSCRTKIPCLGLHLK